MERAARLSTDAMTRMAARGDALGEPRLSRGMGAPGNQGLTKAAVGCLTAPLPAAAQQEPGRKSLGPARPSLSAKAHGIRSSHSIPSARPNRPHARRNVFRLLARAADNALSCAVVRRRDLAGHRHPVDHPAGRDTRPRFDRHREYLERRGRDRRLERYTSFQRATAAMDGGTGCCAAARALAGLLDLFRERTRDPHHHRVGYAGDYLVGVRLRAAPPCAAAIASHDHGRRRAACAQRDCVGSESGGGLYACAYAEPDDCRGGALFVVPFVGDILTSFGLVMMTAE